MLTRVFLAVFAIVTMPVLGYLLFKEIEQTYMIISIQGKYNLISITEPRWQVLFPEFALLMISVYLGAQAFAKPK
jgi:hypothetical protein